MRLKDKGPVIAPPVLSGWAQTVSLEIQSWPGIISATHWCLEMPRKWTARIFITGTPN